MTEVFTAMRTSMSLRQVGLAAVLALAGIYFLVRGPFRAVALPDGSIDFQYCFYVAFRTFAQGGSPYRAEDMLATAQAISARHHYLLLHFYKGAIIYPPGFFVFAPIGLMSLRPALWLWLLIECGAFGALLWWASQLFSTSWTRPQKAAFLACGLSLAPPHTNLAVGNTGILFAALTAALFLALQRKSAGWGGFALGLLMMKPTFGIPAAALVAIWGQWRLLVVGGLVSMLTSLPVLWRLGVRETVAGLVRNLSLHTTPGMPNDETLSNPFHYQFLNLRSWAYGLVGGGWAELLTVLALLALLYALFRFRRQRHGIGPTLYWTLASMFICLAMYHCFYDATLLVIPLAAAFDLYNRRSGWVYGWGAALAPFAVPGTTFLHLKLSNQAHRTPLIEAFIVRHETVALIVLAGLAVAGLYKIGAKLTAAVGAPQGHAMASGFQAK